MADSQILENIRQLKDLTIKGKILWQRENQTTMYFLQQQPASTVSIQKFRVGVSQQNYIFTIIDRNTRNALISINTSFDNSYNEILKELFEIAENSIDKKGLDFFNQILKNV